MDKKHFAGEGALDNLGHLNAGGKNSKALAVSMDGSIVVGVDNFMSSSEAFIWTQADGLLLGLGDLLDNGSVVSSALGVSADGSIVVGLIPRIPIIQVLLLKTLHLPS